jgi:hypothetical protein
MDEIEFKQYREVQECIKKLSETSIETRNKLAEKLSHHRAELLTNPVEAIIISLSEIQLDVEKKFKDLLNLNKTSKEAKTLQSTKQKVLMKRSANK